MPTDPGWWVFQQVRDNHLFVVVCDRYWREQGFPLTLADQEGMMQKLMHLVRKAKGSDNRALLAAMEYGRTSTKEPQRGKGMRNAHAVVDELGPGTLCSEQQGLLRLSARPRCQTGESPNDANYAVP